MSKEGKSKVGKKRKMYAIVLPKSGSNFSAEVEPDEEGLIHVEANTWEITRGSVLDIRGYQHVICPEGSSKTLSGLSVDGNVTAKEYHMRAKANRLKQLYSLLAPDKKWYQNGQTWLMLGVLACAVLVMIWGVAALNGGFEDVARAMSNLDTGGVAPTPGAAAGHKPIGG